MVVLWWWNYRHVLTHSHFSIFQSSYNVFIYIYKEKFKIFYLKWRKNRDHSPRGFNDRKCVSSDMNSIWRPPFTIWLLNNSYHCIEKSYLASKLVKERVTWSNPASLQMEKLRFGSPLPGTEKHIPSFSSLVSQLDHSFQGKSLPVVENLHGIKEGIKI